MNELKPPPPPHTCDTSIAIEPEPPDQHPNASASTDEEQQWIADVIHSATADLNEVAKQHTPTTSDAAYTPFVRKMVHHDYNKRLMQAKQRIASKSNLPPPQSHALHIPTPKSFHPPNILHDTTWKNH